MEPNEQNKQDRPTSEMSAREETDFAKNSAGPFSEQSFPSTKINGKTLFGQRQRRFRGGREPFRFGSWIAITAMLVAIAVLLTFSLTFASLKKKYTKSLEDWELNPIDDSIQGQDAENLKTLESILHRFSLYADTMDTEAMLEAAFKAYVAASGDRYAVFYTEAEYLAMNEATNGYYVGIGVAFREETLNLGDETHTVFSVTSIEKDSPAARAGILVGDHISAVKIEGGWKSIAELGHDAAVNAIRGEAGTSVDLTILRQNEDFYETVFVTCVRDHVESISARGWILDSDPSVAVVRISSFDLNTPTQFMEAVDSCISQGATRFVFDVRENPGGDLRSVRAILSCFLQEGDLILKATDKDGNVSQETLCEPVIYTGDASGCSVLKIGQYRDLDFVVLCDENSASAAEVFTATLRDFKLSRAIVGKTTFGKGIMQSIFELPFKGVKAYIKLTTNSYVTQCGESYHGKGIEPNISVDRAVGTENLSVESLTWEQDRQLQTAVEKLTAIEE